MTLGLWPRLGLALLVPAAFLRHDDRSASDPAMRMAQANFLRNLAAVG